MTHFKMPGPVCQHKENGTIEANETKFTTYSCDTLVLGSGAAGLRAAVELKRRGIDVVVATSCLFGGTSACSGSDKQTLHTVGTSNRGDDFTKMAHDISSGGCMDIDTAYIESVGSLYSFSSLQYLGLLLPQDTYGAVLRYKTDHDEAGRATSCGPLTSRLMTKVLCEEAIRLDVPFLTGCTGVKILTEDGRASGLLVVNPKDKTNQYGLSLITFNRLVLATGGPGELYRDSVYPKACFSAIGMALDAGVRAVNLTESQFGISTNRDQFPWNLSGTYMQVMPYIYSVNEDGDEYNFLAEYYRTTRELASNVFRKGYQWPFQAQRLMNHGSSLVDIAVFFENRKDRKVFMDFKRNPEQVPEDKPFNIEDLDEDVRSYLKNNDGLAALPIDRLRAMNPLAIELYKSHGVDITAEPLQFNVNNQHLNGGLEVDNWGRTSLKNCYAIGETAGTHGVTRPGGAALNAGQVFGTRCAQHIAANISSDKNSGLTEDISGELSNILQELEKAAEGSLSIKKVRSDIQARMSDKTGFVCQADEVAEGLFEAKQLKSDLHKHQLKLESPAETAIYFQCTQMALTSEAILTALDYYIENGGGSRGARVICAEDGTAVPEAAGKTLDELRFREEDLEDRNKTITIQYNSDTENFQTTEKSVNADLELDNIFFEKNWGAYLTGDIYK